MSTRGTDEAVAELFLNAVSPAKIEIALRAMEELEDQRQETLRQWELQLQQADYDPPTQNTDFPVSAEPRHARSFRQKELRPTLEEASLSAIPWNLLPIHDFRKRRSDIMKKVLTIPSFRKAEDFLETEARKLERHLFEFHFGGNKDSREKIVEELTHFQNADGGFGAALEPDVRMRGSSVVATKFALQILIDVKATVEEELVRDGISYLLETYDQERRVWSLVTDEVMDAPHAPWWNVEGLKQEFGSYLANPKAGVLRCLLEYRKSVPDDLIHEATESVMAHLNELSVDMPFFDAISYLLLLEAKDLDEEHKSKLFAKLEKTGETLVNDNPDEWYSFAIKPLWLSPSPRAPLASALEDVIQENLDFEIDNQNEDGSWSPSWAWGDSYPEAWYIAEHEWKGVLTLAMLRSLRDYGRIEGHSPVLAGYKYHID